MSETEQNAISGSLTAEFQQDSGEDCRTPGVLWRVRAGCIEFRRSMFRLADRMFPFKLWGHSVRGLIGNPTFALLPIFYLNRFVQTQNTPFEVLWFALFVLGFPHAGYTALEIRHFLERGDGVAEGRTVKQFVFFSGYFVFGVTLSVYYIDQGSVLMEQRFGIDLHVTTMSMALIGSIGAVMGLRDVLVMDLLLCPVRTLKVAASSVLQSRWMKLTISWMAIQFLLVELARSLVLWFQT